jgi:Mg2+ and Co2+ transporter CorA
MHVQSDIPSSAVQAAPPQLAQLEDTCGRMIRDVGILRKRINELQLVSNVQLDALRDEAKRRKHAERMQAAVELRLGDLADQNEELRIILRRMVEAVETPQSDEAYESAYTFALKLAKECLTLHAREDAA